jgi:hypothetical protein
MRRVAANRPGLATVRGAVASRVHWQLDRLVSKGPSAVIAVACLIVIGIAVLGGVLTLAVTSGSFANRAWSSFTEMLGGPGVRQEGAWPLRLISLAMVVVGIVFVSLVIALVVTALQGSLDRVRNGTPPLRHVPDLVILGWSDQLFTLLREFAVAQGGRSAAIVSARPRAWMDAEIAKECGDIRGRLTVECRTADRADPRDLGLVRIRDVPRVVILGEPDDRDDAAVVKSVFATVTGTPADTDHLIIAEVCGQAVTRSLAEVFDRRLLTVDTNELLALVMAESVREQGMGQLLDQLTSYRGCEFYEHPVPAEFLDKSFGYLAWSLLSASPIGIVRGEDVHVLPAPAMLVKPSDRVVVVDQLRRPLTFATPSVGW